MNEDSATRLLAPKSVREYCASNRGPVRYCLWCGKPFRPARHGGSGQLYDSARCRYAAHNAKKGKRPTLQQWWGVVRKNEHLTAVMEAVKRRSDEQATAAAERAEQAEEEVNRLHHLLQVVSDAIDWEASHQVLTRDKTSPYFAEAEKRCDWPSLLMAYGSWNVDRITAEAQLARNMRERHQKQWTKALQTHPAGDPYLDFLADQMRREEKKLAHQITHWIAYRDVQDARDAYRKEYGAEMPLTDPRLKKQLAILAGGQVGNPREMLKAIAREVGDES